MRGVIMETKNGRAVLLTKDGEFVNIKDKNYSVGDKVNITLNTRHLCAMAASFAVVCAGIGSYFMPAGYVSVDINPSLMMTVNIYNRVIDVKSLNDDARVLLNKIDIKGKCTEDSVEMLIKISEEIGYINDNNRSVILDVVSGIAKPNIENVKYNNIDITKENADMETFRIAKNIGVSIAKAKALEEYTEKNGGDIHSNAAKFNDKSVKEIQNIMLDNSNLFEKKADNKPLQNPKPPAGADENISEQPQPEENRNQRYKPTYNIGRNSFPIGESKREEKADNQPPLNEYRPPENISPQSDVRPTEVPPALNEQPHGDITPINNHPPQPEQKPQDNNISQSKAQQTGKPAQQNPPAYTKPLQTEQTPQDSTSVQSVSKPQGGILKPSKPAHGDDKPSTNNQQITEPKPQDSIPNQDGENAPNNPSQSDGQTSEITIPSDKQPPAEQKPDAAGQDNDKPQDNPAVPDEPKREPGIEQGSQPPQPDNDTYESQPSGPKQENNMPPQAEPKPQENEPMQNNNVPRIDAQQPSEPKREDASPQNGQPQQSEPKPQNDGGNYISNEDMSRHGENTEIP